MPHGKGKLIDCDGNIYEGNFHDGYMNKGIITYKDKQRYEGDVYDTRLRHGRGKMFNADGKKIFEGNYRNDLPSQKYFYNRAEDHKLIEDNKFDITDLYIELANN